MKKLSLAVSAMIVTGFLMKSYRKLRERPEPELDAIHTQRDAGTASLIDSLMHMDLRGSHG